MNKIIHLIFFCIINTYTHGQFKNLLYSLDSIIVPLDGTSFYKYSFQYNTDGTLKTQTNFTGNVSVTPFDKTEFIYNSNKQVSMETQYRNSSNSPSPPNWRQTYQTKYIYDENGTHQLKELFRSNFMTPEGWDSVGREVIVIDSINRTEENTRFGFYKKFSKDIKTVKYFNKSNLIDSVIYSRYNGENLTVFSKETYTYNSDGLVASYTFIENMILSFIKTFAYDVNKNPTVYMYSYINKENYMTKYNYDLKGSYLNTALPKTFAEIPPYLWKNGLVTESQDYYKIDGASDWQIRSEEPVRYYYAGLELPQINLNKENTNFSVHPIPAQESINVDLISNDNCEFILRNLEGKILKEGVFRSTKNKIDLENISAGIYILEIIFLKDGNRAYQKIFKN